MIAALETEPLVEARSDETGRSAKQEQVRWASRPVASRLAVLRTARGLLASASASLCAAIPPALARTPADTRAAEILPLLEACRFLERRAERILSARRPGRRGLPMWLAGVESEVHRVPFGQILVIGPFNYPLFLPGAQTLQALAAGNAVVWKPGRGGLAVAQIFARILAEAGLPDGLLVVTGESIEAGRDALAGRVTGAAPDKVIFTGSAETGRTILRQLAETATPCVMELSGCDAVLVLPSADPRRVARAMAFGMRLNGSATCMAPRRLMLVGLTTVERDLLVEQLHHAFAAIDGVEIAGSVRSQLNDLLGEARHAGAEVFCGGERLPGAVLPGGVQPVLVTGASTAMRLAQADVFAPVLCAIEIGDVETALAELAESDYALTVSVFGEEPDARALASRLTAGTILVNDVIVPTADPRMPFGGRRKSGFGTTRGAEGLLEMTAPKTVAVRRGKSVKHYEATGPRHEELFDGVILATHAATWGERWNGLKRLVAAARAMKDE